MKNVKPLWKISHPPTSTNAHIHLYSNLVFEAAAAAAQEEEEFVLPSTINRQSSLSMISHTH